jgi:hypothetical protein
LLLVDAQLEFLDGLRVERRQVVRPAAADEPAVDDHLLVSDPLAAGIPDVGLEPRGLMWVPRS